MCLTHKVIQTRAECGLVHSSPEFYNALCGNKSNGDVFSPLCSVCVKFSTYMYTYIHSAVSYEPPYYISDIKGLAYNIIRKLV